MLCRSCGAQIPDNSKFCVDCGTKIETEQPGVVQQKNISNKHYSLEDIAKQQSEDKILPQPELNRAQEQKSFEQPVGALAGEPYKMKSAGFADETEPVKRPPITEPIQAENNPSAQVQPKRISPFDTYKTQSSNNGSNSEQSGRVNPFSANNTEPQTNNYSFNGTSNQNNNSFGSNNTEPQTNNYSSNVKSYQGNIPLSNNVTSKSNSKVAKIMLIIGIAVAVLLIGVIIYMIVSGYYNGNGNTADTNITNPASNNLQKVDFSELVYSNQANYSLATEDDKGNIYYASEDNYIIKRDSSGTETEIYDAWVMCLNYYNGRLYFISEVSGYSTVCSIDTDGENLKTHTNQKDVSMLCVSDGYAYYVINEYGSSSNSGAVFRVNLTSGTVDNVIVEDNSDVYAVFDYGDSIYVHSMDIDTYIGTLKKISKSNLNQVTEINNPSSIEKYDYYSITISGGKFYFVNCDSSNDYSIYSMDMDGSNGRIIGEKGKDCSQIAIYGDYIYYVYGKKYALNRMKTDGSDDVCIKTAGVSSISFAGDRIYYMNSETDEMMGMNLDGTDDKILNSK